MMKEYRDLLPISDDVLIFTLKRAVHLVITLNFLILAPVHALKFSRIKRMFKSGFNQNNT